MAAFTLPPWTGTTMESPCFLNCAVDGINLLFLFTFLLLQTSTKSQPKFRASGCFSSTLSASFSAAISFIFFASGIFHFFTGIHDGGGEGDGGFCNFRRRWWWLVSFARFLIWISMASSYMIKKTRFLTFFTLLWFSTFFFLSSIVNLYCLIQYSPPDIWELIPWPVTFFLFTSSLHNLLTFPRPDDTGENILAEPLLLEKTARKTGFCRAGVFSKMTFSWLNPLLSLGYSRPLVLDDVPSLSPEDEAVAAYKKLADSCRGEEEEEEEEDGEGIGSKNCNRLIPAIWKVYFKDPIVVVCALVRTISTLVSPLLIYSFVGYHNKEKKRVEEGVVLVGVLVFAKMAESISQRHMFFESRRQGMRLRSALMVAVYKKELKLSSSGRRRHSTGEMVNYIAVDSYRMGEAVWWFHLAWSLTLQLLLSVGILVWVVGVGAIGGVVTLLLCAGLNIPIARALRRCQTGLMEARDERLRASSEVLNNMKIIKLQSWEGRFMKGIESVREKEFRWLSEAQFQRAYCSILYWMSPTLISSVVFTGCLVFGSVGLDAGTMFTVLATLRGLSEPVRVVPDALSFLIQVRVSLDRLESFFRDEEVEEEEEEDDDDDDDTSDDDVVVRMKDGSFSWDLGVLLPPTLKNLNFEVRRGETIAICGPVGAGKSSLFYALLREMPRVSATFSVAGSVGYVAQVSWIQSGTIRENILYGKPMDNSRYQHVIKACALDKDIHNFIHSDLTEIGQRGLNLSGGQKQRIQLARALYNDADIYLLDDPFSALDAHTAALLFHEYVLNALKSKTVFLVTHQVEYLSQVDKIMVMKGGEVTQTGSYEELLRVGTSLERLVKAHKSAIEGTEIENKERGAPAVEGEREALEESGVVAERGREGGKGSQLTEEEWKEMGDIGLKPLVYYVMVSKGLPLLCFIVVGQVGFLALQAASVYWIAFALAVPHLRRAVLVGVYTLISVSSVVFVYARTNLAARFGLRASSAFFSAITAALFKAPMLFFDTTPVGRIFTRISSDMNVLDVDLPFTFFFVVWAGIDIISIVGVMASVTWQVVVVAVPILVACHYVQKYCVASVTELVRINGTTKAPLMNYVGETSSGVVTIRAFKMGERFFQNYLKLVDRDAKLFFHSNAAMEWVVLRVEALQNLTLVVSSCLLLFLPSSSVPEGLVGLSLSYAMTLTACQVFFTRWFCNLLNYIISVERIEQYTRIPREAPEIVEEQRPPSWWPSHGKIELRDLKVRYRERGELVLKGITCTMEGGSKVGVVGRTGSGKTTLITALFRLVEAEGGGGGRVVIDGVDVRGIGVRDLRTKLSIIPQEPTLFRGSIRTNLDPLGIYSDDCIWDALHKCQLKHAVSCLPGGLDSIVSEEGENWSVGERQLVCLGRVLLRRNRILIMDEATASIDTATDRLLHRVIREEFEECTVITVAHRIPTVIHSDMVLVLSYGNAVEYDKPWKLMERESLFSNLVAQYWASCTHDH